MASSPVVIETGPGDAAGVEAEVTEQVEANADAAVDIAEAEAAAAVDIAQINADRDVAVAAVIATEQSFENEVRQWLALHGDPTHPDLLARIAALEGSLSSLSATVAAMTPQPATAIAEGDGASAVAVAPDPAPSPQSEPAPIVQRRFAPL